MNLFYFFNLLPLLFLVILVLTAVILLFKNKKYKELQNQPEKRKSRIRVLAFTIVFYLLTIIILNKLNIKYYLAEQLNITSIFCAVLALYLQQNNNQKSGNNIFSIFLIIMIITSLVDLVWAMFIF